MSAVLFCALVGTGFVLLARWGRRNAEQLVLTGRNPARREKELRSLRRGARSCYLIGGLFGGWAVVTATGLLLGG